MAPPANPLIATRNTAGDIVDLGLLVLAAAGAATAALLGLWWLAVLAALPSLGADLFRGQRPATLRRIAQRLQLGPPARSLVRNGLVVAVLATTAPRVAGADLAALLVAVMAVHLGQVAYLALGGPVVDAELARTVWRDLEVDGAVDGPPRPVDAVGGVAGVDGIRAMTAGEVLLLAGVAAAAVGVPGTAIVAAALSIALVLAADVLGVLHWRGPHGAALFRDTDRELASALERLRPEVVFYFASPASGTYALGVWVDVINAMRRPTLVVLREEVHLAGVPGITRPTVVVRTYRDLERLLPASVAVVLYSVNVVKNNDMVRLPGPMHAFIGHGDSDKVGSFSPLNRLYDEIWVAGDAAIERYAQVDEGIDLGAVRAVGRPQLAEIARAAPRGPGAVDRATVLYAPTWEGFFDEADYSSVAAMGVGLARGVLESGARLLFKPHPLTGHRLPAALEARETIEALIRRAGDGSAVVAGGPDALYTAFNEADVLLSDISSVITDFLASRKPYLVTNKHDVPRAEFVRSFPSAGAAYLVGSDLAALPAALTAAAGVDPERPARLALATHLLGDDPDPLAAFLDHVDDFVDRARARVHAADPLRLP